MFDGTGPHSFANPEKRARALERLQTPEAQTRWREGIRRYWSDPNARVSRRGKARAPQVIEKMRQASLRLWQDPAYRARQMANRPKRVHFTPEMDETLRRMHAGSDTFKATAKRVGVSIRTLMRRVDELGLPRVRGIWKNRKNR